MSNLWVGGLVVALGWLSVRAAEPNVQAPPTPLFAPAGTWANRQEPKASGVTLGKPVALAAAAPLPLPDSVAPCGPPDLPALPSTVPNPAPADTPPPSAAIDQDVPSVPKAMAPSTPSELVTRAQSPDDSPPPKIPSPDLTAPPRDCITDFAADRAYYEAPKIRQSESPQSPNSLAADYSSARPGEGVRTSEVKQSGFVETAGPKPTVWRAVAKSEDDTPQIPQPLIASAEAHSKEDAQDLPPLPKNDADTTPSTGTKFAEDPPLLHIDPVDKPAKPADRTPLPIGNPDKKAAKQPIAKTPASRLGPKPTDSTTPACATPCGAASEQVICADPPRFYASGEYLLWFTKGGHVPPLVTTGPASSNGILGQPGTVVLFGGPGTTLNDDVRQGGRFTLGYWLDPCQQCAIEGSFFFLENETTRFNASSDAFPLLARPFFRINTGSEFSEITTRPDLTTGNLHIESPTRFWGAELNARHNLCCGCTYRVDGLLGGRYLDLKDGLHITEDLIGTPTLPTFANDHIVVTDLFDTHNQFYGGQVGIDSEWRRGRFFVDFRGKVALGDNHETLDIQGSQIITTPQGNVQTFRGGLLALPSNIGHFTRDRFSVVPEATLAVGCQVTERLRVSVGYNVLWWSNVLRAGDQIDRVLDETQIPNFGAVHPPAGQNRPAVLFKETDYWAQGIQFSVEFRY